MANILLTGATGGIGRHLSRHLAIRHEVMTLSRRPSADSAFAPCDLVREMPSAQDAGDPAVADRVDWIIHAATTYRIDDDLAMLDNLIAFAHRHRVKHFLYVSSWVVHFPRRPFGASYIEMKRRCERRLLESGLVDARIIRPSVVVGPDLSWSRILHTLAPFAALIPPRFTRSFVSVEEVCGSIEKIIDGRTRAVAVTCLGERMSLADKARESRGAVTRPLWPVAVALGLLLTITLLLAPSTRMPIALSLGAGLLLLLALRHLLPAILGSVSDYFAGFVDRCFEPDGEQDVIALCHRDNANIDVRGYDNARLYFYRPHSPHRTTVVLRRFKRVLSLDRDRRLLDVQAGAHFGELLPLLESHGLWLDNYPNYHYISVGACITTAVHGSNLTKPFMADLVECVRYYDREADEVVQVRRDDHRFAALVFDQGASHRHVILSAQLRVCPRQYYELTSTPQPVEALRFADAAGIAAGTQHHEVRINTPMSRTAVVQSYRQVPVDAAGGGTSANDGRLLAIKADAIGRKWNVAQANGVFSTLSSLVSRSFINFEWFFPPERFEEFWQEIRRDRSRYRMYKLLVRHNRRQPEANTPYHGTMSIDVTIFNTRAMLEVAAESFQRFRPLEHQGKYSIARYIDERKGRAVGAVSSSP